MNSICRRLVIMLALCAVFQPAWVPAAGFKLSIAPSGNKVVVTWPTNAANYVLQSTTNLSLANWQIITNPLPVVVSTNNSVTYTNNSSARFFRLYLNNIVSGFYLSIARAATNTYLLWWPTAASNYVLQTTVTLSPAAWQTVSVPAPVTIGTTNFLTYTNNSTTRFFRLYFNTNSAASSHAGMVAIPGGTFTMGDVADTNLDGTGAAIPTNVTVSGFYMDTNLVTYSLWQSVYNAALSAGYTFDDTGAGQGTNHPVQTVNWYDAVKWCNARSVQAGLTPVYYTDAAMTLVYTNGDIDAVYVNWSVNGFRLPSETEWERAARAGLSGQRFPWGSTISESQANYFGYPTNYGGYFYDLGPNYGYEEVFESQGQPYTSPVGYFAPNGYGLNDMAGDVLEWCWDWYAAPPYPTGSPYLGGTNPHGPSSSPNSSRVARGGDWSGTAEEARCADRSDNQPPDSTDFSEVGFRCVRTN
jgi:formylglycine-generating enzyme required for sulfatase activity